MTPRKTLFACAVLLILASAAQATSFVVPTDEQMIAKSAAIVIGTVEGSFVQETNGTIETVYEIRVERALKGAQKSAELLRVVSLGGVIGDRGLYVAGAPRFAQGDRVLLFLTNNKDRWETTDLTLGKFKFVTSTAGERLLVRDMEDVVGWDQNGEVHHENVRRESGFLDFIQVRVRGGAGTSNYVVEASKVTLPPDPARPGMITNAAPFPAATYTGWVQGQPTRWPNISAGVTFFKRADQNISGLGDGGVSVIQNSLAAWTNDCASNVVLNYGGTTSTPSANFDNTHVVEFNDPQGRISGSWTGSGTIGICFTSFSGTHSFSGQTWWNISDADVVFQDGFPGTHSGFATAMTHELGHGIGWRHSNQDYSTGGACNSSVEECTSAAIMNSSVNTAYNYTLQTWDKNAVQSVYPGGTCGPTCTAPTISAQPQSATISAGSSRTLSVTASGTAPLSYQWYIGTSGSTSNPISGATSSSVTVTPSSTTSYWVRVTNSCGSVNSSTATITVTTTPPPTGRRTRGDYNGDGKTDAALFRPSTGQWLIRNIGTIQWGQNGDKPVPGDWDGDRKTDTVIFRPTQGMWFVRYATGAGTSLQWGVNGDIPAQEDFDGDGKTDYAVYRPGQGMWFISYAKGGGTSVAWGVNGDIPVPADYNGDGIADIAIFRPSNGQWQIRNIGNFTLGANGDIPVPADYNNDGSADVAVFRPSNGQWLIRNATTIQWGQNGDQPVPGDYDGDARMDVAVYRPSQGMWYVRYATGAGTSFMWGLSGDIALSK